MVFKGAATLIVRLSRAIFSRPFKPIYTPRTHQIPQLNKHHHHHRFYLFPSIYRSFFTPAIGQNLSSLMPFRMALNEIKRRLFFTGLYLIRLRKRSYIIGFRLLLRGTDEQQNK
jgi:hypothetical protein